MPDLCDFLRRCGESERLVRDFYRLVADRFSEDEEAAELFSRMAIEEEGHAKAFEFLLAVASRYRGRATVHENFEPNLERLRRGVERATESLRGAHPGSLADAVGIACLIEATTLERDKGAFADVPDHEFRSLLDGVVVSDEGHRRKLEAFRQALIEAA